MGSNREKSNIGKKQKLFRILMVAIISSPTVWFERVSIGVQYKHIMLPERRGYYSKNLSILNSSSYSDGNLFWDAKILRTQEMMALFKS